MSRRHALIALPLLLLIAACDQAQKTEIGPGLAAEAEAVDPTSLEARIAPHVDGPLALDEYAVGPLMGATAFDRAEIQRLFPKAVVEQASIDDGEGARPVLTVRQGGTQILEIGRDPGSGAVGEIRITGGQVQAPNNETLGMTWRAAGFEPSRCWMGKDRDAHAVICTRRGEPVLRYVFEAPGWTSREMPPAEVLQAKAVLRAFFWKGSSPIAPVAS